MHFDILNSFCVQLSLTHRQTDGRRDVRNNTVERPALKMLFAQQPTLTTNSLGDEIANVNYFYEDIVQALQNTIDSCINCATDRRGYVLERMFTKSSEITQCNGHYDAVKNHSRSPILVPIENSCRPTTSYYD